MKKILSLLLILACVFSLAACSIDGPGNNGDDPTPPPAGEEAADIFAIAAAGTVPTKIVSLSTWTGKDLMGANVSLSGSFSQVVSGNNSILDFKYDRFAAVEEAADDYIVSVEGAIAVKDGKTKSVGEAFGEKDWEAVIPSLQQQGAFKLDKNALPADYVLSSDGQKLTVSLTKAEALQVIGVVIDAAKDSEISLSVESNGKNISMVVISYTAASGASVRIASSYTYGVQELDFSKFN